MLRGFAGLAWVPAGCNRSGERQHRLGREAGRPATRRQLSTYSASGPVTRQPPREVRPAATLVELLASRASKSTTAARGPRRAGSRRDDCRVPRLYTEKLDGD